MMLFNFGILLMFVLTVDAFHFWGFRPRPNRPRPNRREPNRREPNRREPNRAPANIPQENVPSETGQQANVQLADRQANVQIVPAVTLLCDDYRVDPEDNQYFIRTIKVARPWQDVRIKCPYGTVFVQSLCTCFYGDTPIQDESVAVPECIPQVELLFNDGDFGDTSINNLKVGPKYVNIVNGSALFNGKGKITIDLFSDVEFKQQLEIRFRFKQDESASWIETLVTNSDNSNGFNSSVAIGIDSTNNWVMFTTITDQDEATVAVPFAPGEWNEATYIYDGAELFGEVTNGNNSTANQTASLYGDILVREGGILLGGGIANGFTGSIDDFRLYRCFTT